MDLCGQDKLWISIVQHDDRLWCTDMLAHSNVVGQSRLLAALRHVNHCYVGVVKLIENVGLTKVQPLETNLMKIDS